MSQVNEDPILDIRRAVAYTLNELGFQSIGINEKVVTDRIVDHLPDFFRSPLMQVPPVQGRCPGEIEQDGLGCGDKLALFHDIPEDLSDEYKRKHGIE